MTNDELNKYIEHYIEKDQTGRALMLTGAWGIGKSYYIKNTLIPFLEKKEQKNKKAKVNNKNCGKHPCIVVSLYGISSLSELSKAIYFETRLKNLNTDSEAGKIAILAGKTVLKGVASIFGVDISASADDMKNVYESIDLSGKLLILEDVERSQINILELLGYVNSLVEQDGVKVLLVTNEEELLKYKPIIETEPKTKDDILNTTIKQKTRIFTDETLQYLIIKEKTVGDTISFSGDLQNAAKTIMNSFNNDILQKFNNDQGAKNIEEIMFLMKSSNLRSVIFACQKTVDIYELIPNINSYSEDFISTILYGILFFSFRLHAGERMHWEGLTHFSMELGGGNHPLFRFCFDYIQNQSFVYDEISLAAQALEEMRLYDPYKTSNDSDLQHLYGYYLGTEADIIKAVERITNRLNDSSDIAFSEYGKIAVHLIIVKYHFGISIEIAKTRLISNLFDKNKNLTENDIFWYTLGESTEEATAEYNQLRHDMLNSLYGKGTSFLSFDYSPESIDTLCEFIRENKDSIFKDSGLLKYFDISLFVEMLVKSNAVQMDNLRTAFHNLYNLGNIANFLPDDKEPIKLLLECLQKNEKRFSKDKVKYLQFKWFANIIFEIKKKYE
ncbi:MAG: hypothetical protein IK082_12970 [Oscillospiraceae bacterium]|nr:hypothetical protein [Oscillospiraceae bacterium]